MVLILPQISTPQPANFIRSESEPKFDSDSQAPAVVDPNDDLLTILRRAKEMADAAVEVATALTTHERRLSRINHGHFDGNNATSAEAHSQFAGRELRLVER
jgi:hypothetical protein